MAGTSVSTKEEKMERVAEATLKIVSQHGLGGIRIAAVAKAAGVSRPWLYKYIGRTDEVLVELMADTFGQAWARMDLISQASDKEGWIRDTIAGYSAFLDATMEYPWALQIYFRYRGTQNPLGQRIEWLELQYIKRQAEEIQRCLGLVPARARVVADVLLGVRLGLGQRWLCGALQKQTGKKALLEFLDTSLRALT